MVNIANSWSELP